MKKIIGLLLVATMMFSYSIPTYASGGWSAHYEEPTTSVNPIDHDSEYMEIVNMPATDHYSGVASKVSYAQFSRDKQNETYLFIENSLNGNLVKNKYYDFSFYAKGTFENKGIYAGIGTNENLTSGGMVSFLKTARYTTEDKGNSWKLYKFSNILYDGSGNHFRIKIVQKCSSLYVDDVTLTLHNDTNNLIVDSGFENSTYVETDDIGNSADYAPKNIAVAQRTGHIVLGWKNPKNANLSKVSLYDITEGDEKKITDSLSKTADGYVEYDVKNLEEGKTYTFKILCNFGKVTTTETIVSGTASEKRPSTLMNMSYQGNHPGTAYIDHSDTHSEGGALRVISNKPVWTSNDYLNLDTDTVNFNDTDEFEVSVWLKGTFGANTTESGKINYKDVLRPAWSNFKAFEIRETDENGWVNVVYPVTGIGSNPLKILAEHRTDLLVDDIEVWKMSDGERFSQVFKQDFNSLDSEIDDVENLKSNINRNMAKISWQAPSNAQKVRVYVKDEDNLSLRAEVNAKDGVIFNHLKNDYIYTYVVKAVDTNNNESEGVEITVTPTPDDFECNEYGLYKSDVLQKDFYGGTSFVAKALLKNNKIEDGLNAQIIAILRKDGERIDATASALSNIEKTKYDANGTEIKTTISVPNDITDGEYEISVYLWNGLENMSILKPFKVYKESIE